MTPQELLEDNLIALNKALIKLEDAREPVQQNAEYVTIYNALNAAWEKLVVAYNVLH